MALPERQSSQSSTTPARVDAEYFKWLNDYVSNFKALKARRGNVSIQRAQAEQDLKAVQSGLDNADREFRALNSEINAIKSNFREQTGLDLDSLLCGNATVESKSSPIGPRSASVTLQNKIHGKGRAESDLFSHPSVKRPRHSVDHVPAEVPIEMQKRVPLLNHRSKIAQTEVVNLRDGNWNVRALMEVPIHQHYPSTGPMPMLTKEYKTRTWLRGKVEHFVRSKYRQSQMDSGNIQRLADTAIQLFTLNIILQLSQTRPHPRCNPDLIDFARLLDDPNFANLSKREREGRCGLSRRLIEAIYRTTGPEIKPYMRIFSLSSLRKDNNVQYSISAIFDEPDPSSKMKYAGKTWLYREITTLIRTELSSQDRPAFELCLRTNAAKFLSFLPAIRADTMFPRPTAAPKTDSHDTRPGVPNATRAQSTLEGFGWHGTCFNMKQPEARSALWNIQIANTVAKGQPQDVMQKRTATTAERQLFESAIKDIVIWDGPTSIYRDGREISPLIFDHTPLYGNMSIWDDPIISLVD